MSDDDGALEDPVDSPSETGAKVIELPDGTRFISAPRWVIRYASRATRFFERPAAWLIFVLTGGWVSYETAASRLDGGENAISILIDEYLFRTVLGPIAVSLWEMMVGAVATLMGFIFGSDGSVGVSEGGTPGIVDLPLVLADLITGPVLGFTGGIADQIASLNASVAAAVEPLGLAAPVVVTGLWTFEVFAAMWLTWTLMEAIPGFDLTDILLSVTAPIRNIIRGLT